MSVALTAAAGGLLFLTLAGLDTLLGFTGGMLVAGVVVILTGLSLLYAGRLLREERLTAARRLRAFQRAAGIGMFEWDLAKPHAEISAEYRAMMGLPPGQRLMTREEWAALIHPDDRTAATEALRKAIEENEPFDVEYRVRRPDGSVLWTGSRAVVFRDEAGRPVRVLGAMLDIDARKRAELAVLERERMFRHIADAAPVMIWVSDETGALTFFSRACYDYTGRGPREALGDGWLAAVHPDDHERVLAAFDQALRDHHAFTIDMRVRRHDGVYHWMIETGAPRFETGGTFVGFIGLMLDIQDRKEAEARHALLMREIDHRAKNALAVVASIIRMTRADSMEAYVAAVEGRVEAMARAHSLLAASRWRGTPLHRLLEEEVGVIQPVRHRMAFDGPPVIIAADGVQPLTLVLHELATNALKHGALAAPEGRLSLSWRIKPGGDLVLRWQERGGSPLLPPQRRGFGLELLETLAEKQLQGTIAFQWAEGLNMQLRIPRTLYTPQSDAPAAPDKTERPAAPPPPGPIAPPAGQRILVVEDDVLIALSMQEMLEEFGYRVVGPAYDVEEALAVLEVETPDAALLDMNLGGRLSTDVAARLEGLGVPFAYCTGYGDRAHLRPDVPVVAKPFSAAAVAKTVADLLRRAPR